MLLLAAQTVIGTHQARQRPRAVVDIRRAAQHEVVVLGDSVNHTVDPSDQNRAWVSTLLAGRLGRRVGAASRGGWDLEVFEAAIEHITRTARSPRTVLITVNLASLWGDGRTPFTTHRNIALDLRRSDSWVWAMVAQPLRVFRGPGIRPSISLEEYLERPVRYRGQTLGVRRDFEPGSPRFAMTNAASLRDHVIVRYLQPLEPGNRLLAAASRSARRLTARGHRAIFFVVPVDVERCAVWAPEIHDVLAAKVEAVRRAIEPYRAQLLDLSRTLSAEFFIPSPYPNEHLNERGRRELAARLAAAVNAGGPH